ncbi:hypothetical protein F511_43432 [Dorcoceras hygrometricum]|uniref:Uncharacterized protein n=1 Tax=Dorcoceras hygrometricum TaxID=472368 RepID=A0A2Z6ZYQ1_9LAMI|nr:hypothetical protein F511_43432 [Dorcoceras hygrometricum]
MGVNQSSQPSPEKQTKGIKWVGLDLDETHPYTRTFIMRKNIDPSGYIILSTFY